MQTHAVTRYLRSRGWFLLFCAVLAVWIAVRMRPPSEHAKWEARIKVESNARGEVRSGSQPPCFFLMPHEVDGQELYSSYVEDCLPLLPDGKKLDVFEIALGGGFFPIKTDLYVPDTMPLAFTRTCVPLTDWSRGFQIYLPHVYEPFMTGSRRPYTDVYWRLPDGRSIHYERISPGTDFADAIYGAVPNTGFFADSRVNWNGNGWDWALADSLTYLSPEAYYATRPQQGSLVGIFDKNGTEVRLTREASGELTEIRSPHGGWIRLHYSQLHMVRAQASSGDVVEYEYDRTDHLRAVKYPGGQTIRYSYDAAARIIKVEEPGKTGAVEIKYELSGSVASVELDSKHTYTFTYVSDKDPETTKAFVAEPSGKVIRIVIHNSKNGMTSYAVQR